MKIVKVDMGARGTLEQGGAKICFLNSAYQGRNDTQL